MSNQSVEKHISRQKWVYRILFFVVHVIFYVLTMLVVWGTVTSNAQLSDIFINNESGAATILILPTIMWTAVVLFHIASLFYESSAGEKAIREKLLMREVREEMLRKGLVDEGILEKPKRRATMLSDDGELIQVDEDEPIEQTGYNTRVDHVANS